MRIVTFASGSSGNCALVSYGSTHLLIDAGISLRRIRAALLRQYLEPEDLAGVLITHEHGDHISALPMLVKHHALPVYAPRTVGNSLCRRVAGMEEYLRTVVPGEPFSVKELRVTAFPTPHDTDESVGYALEGDVRFGFCTDTGHISEEMLASLSGCDGVLIEANHDLEMLRFGAYPVYLKRRILSPRGHLSNDDCAELACRLAEAGARYIALGHLSRENNRPSLARETVRRALDAAGYTAAALSVAPAEGELVLEIAPC